MQRISQTLERSWVGGLPKPLRIHVGNIQTGNVIRFAESSLRFNLSRLTAHRLLRRESGKSWISTSVEVSKTSFFGKKKHLHSITRGEDPRLFLFSGKPWVMIQIFNESALDIDVQIIELTSGVTFSLSSPLGFNGKNWVPFEMAGKLHFAYSLDPLVIMVASFKGATVELKVVTGRPDFKPSWGLDVVNSIGVVRGGSPGLAIGDSILGFSHAINLNEDVHAHRLGFYEIDFGTLTIRHKFITTYTPSFLFDAYGAIRNRGELIVQGSLALGDIHQSDSQVATVEIAWSLVELRAWLIED